MAPDLAAGVITIGIDPEIVLGPLTLTWHGVMTAVGIVVGALVARAFARRRGLDPDEITGLVFVLALAGMVGARAFYLLENDAAALLQPNEWLGTRGFSFYGAILLGVPAAALYLRRRGLGLPYLDALAFGFPAGSAVGRIGDVINGEHFGPPSDLPWAIQYVHPQAEVPSAEVAYHSGGLYEVVLALAIFAVVWRLRDRVLPAGTLLWLVIGLYGVGRFAMFFVREDSDTLALGLNGAQWTSLLLIAVAAVGLLALKRSRWTAALLAASAAVAVTALTACGTGSSDSDADASAVEEVLDRYLAAVADGRGEDACAMLTPEAQLGVFDFRLVHAGADHPEEACTKIVERNRLRGEAALAEAEVTAIEVDGEAASASVEGSEAELERVGNEWRIARFGLAESVVPGDRPPPKSRPTTLN